LIANPQAQLAADTAAGVSRGRAVPHSPEEARAATSWSWR